LYCYVDPYHETTTAAECSQLGTCVGEERLKIEVFDDNFGVSALATWGGCVYPSESLESEIVLFCGDYGVPYSSNCIYDYNISPIPDAETCADNGGVWVSPSEDGPACISDQVEYF
jgi:hypothetical protein